MVSAASRALRPRHVEVEVDSAGGPLQLCPSGDSVQFETDFMVGSVFFAHRPQAGGSAPNDFYHGELLAGRGEPTPLWEVQIQCRFKEMPSGTCFFGLELWDGPMQLGLVTKAMAKVILKFGTALARQRGVDVRHAFGNNLGEVPLIAFPLRGADRIFSAETPVELPIAGDDQKGFWNQVDGQWRSIDKSTFAFDTKHYFTFLFASPRVDWIEWTIPGIPGVGTLELKDFWGAQAAHIVIFDEKDNIRRRFFSMKLHSKLGMSSAATVKNIPNPVASNIAAVISPIQDTENTIPAAVVAAENLCELEDEPLFERQISGDKSLFENSTKEYSEEQALLDLLIDDVPDDVLLAATIELDDVPDVVRLYPGVGVRVKQTGRSGKLLLDDGSELPYKVEFKDGDLPATDWFRVIDIELDDNANINIQASLECSDEIVLHVDQRVPSECANILEYSLEYSFIEEKSSAKDAIRNCRAELPWYFRSSANALWWCILSNGSTSWRPHMHVEALLEDGTLPGQPQSAEGLENTRRQAATALAEGRNLPGYFEGETDLSRLLSAELSSAIWEMVGVVEAEGCIVERAACIIELLHLRAGPTGETFSIPLTGALVEDCEIAGAPALLLLTPERQFGIVFRNATIAQEWKIALQTEAARSPTARRSEYTVEVPLRWEQPRLVLNNGHLCLTSRSDALELSAECLREAISAQQDGPSAIQHLAITTSFLKCVNLNGLSPQAVWSFWVNVFHCLLVHAQLVCGRPEKLRHIVRFFNNSSYIVAGHAFSLTEIEHSCLRHRMSEPHFRLRRFFLKVVPRSDEVFEQRPCLAAPYCPASSFRCRPDWRLNLVLSAGNGGSSDAVPVFEPCDAAKFDSVVGLAMSRTLACAGSSTAHIIILPYTLSRYRDDAPPDGNEKNTELRWLRAMPGQYNDLQRGSSVGRRSTMRVRYSTSYDWVMRTSGLTAL